MPQKKKTNPSTSKPQPSAARRTGPRPPMAQTEGQRAISEFIKRTAADRAGLRADERERARRMIPGLDSLRNARRR